MNIKLLEDKFSNKSVKTEFLCLLLEDTLALLEQANLNNLAVVELMTYQSKENDYNYTDTFTSKYFNSKTDWDSYVKLNNEEILQQINKLKLDKKNKAFALEIIDYDEYLENLENEKKYRKFLELLKKYESNKNGLLSEISTDVTDEMLDTISKADYGWKSEVCFPILQKIRDTKTTPLKTEFIVGETLSLTQWGEPKTPEEHIERLFCSTTLLMLYPTDGISIGYNEIAPLAVFMESIYTFNNSYHKQALSLIIWRMLFEEEYEYQDDIDSLLSSSTNEFYIYTLILLLILNQKAEEDVNFLVQMLIEIDKNSRIDGLFVENETFLLGLTNHDYRHNIWKANSEKMLTQLDYITDTNLKETLQQIGKAIIEDKGFLR